MSSPKFSIIVPIYNTEKYLRQCIESILNQDFEDYELWLVDDGSKDSSIEIIKEYEKIDKRIKTGFIKGSGPAEPRNYALRRATGEYILFVDSDDYLTSKSLNIFNKAISDFPDADFIRGNQRILVDNKIEEPSVFAESRSNFANRILDGETFLVDVLQRDYAPIDALFKRQFLVNNNIEFHEELVILEDGPFISEICASNVRCLYINDETYVYRLFTPGSVTNSSKTLQKSLSLIRGAQYYLKIADKFDTKGKFIMEERASDHSVAGIYQACRYLSNKDAKEVYCELKRLNKKLLPISSYNKHHIYFIKLYNFSKPIAYHFLKFIIGVKKIIKF